jgi:hypothetical protein
MQVEELRMTVAGDCHLRDRANFAIERRGFVYVRWIAHESLTMKIRICRRMARSIHCSVYTAASVVIVRSFSGKAKSFLIAHVTRISQRCGN